MATSLAHTLGYLTGRLDVERRSPARHGQAVLDRDLEVHRLTTRPRRGPEPGVPDPRLR